MDNQNNKVENKNSNPVLDLIAWWRLDKDEIEEQIRGYNSLSPFKSARGVSCLLVFGVIVFNILAVFLNWTPRETLVEIVVLLPLLLLMFKGYRLAFILMMIFWTIEKGITAYIIQANHLGTTSLLMNLIMWAFLMKFFYGALVIESKRKSVVPTVNNLKTEAELVHKRNLSFGLVVAKRPIALIIIITFLLVAWFYWFQYRPTQIRHDCSQTTVNTAYQKDWTIEQAKAHYEFCLHEKGL